MDPSGGQSPAQFPGERSSGHVGMAPQVEDGQGARDSAGDPLGRTVAGAFPCLDPHPPSGIEPLPVLWDVQEDDGITPVKPGSEFLRGDLIHLGVA